MAYVTKALGSTRDALGQLEALLTLDRAAPATLTVPSVASLTVAGTSISPGRAAPLTTP